MAGLLFTIMAVGLRSYYHEHASMPLLLCGIRVTRGPRGREGASNPGFPDSVIMQLLCGHVDGGRAYIRLFRVEQLFYVRLPPVSASRLSIFLAVARYAVDLSDLADPTAQYRKYCALPVAKKGLFDISPFLGFGNAATEINTVYNSFLGMGVTFDWDVSHI